MKKLLIVSLVIVLSVSCFATYRHYRMISSDFHHKADLAMDAIHRLTFAFNDQRWLDAQKAVADAGYSVSTVPDRKLDADLSVLLSDMKDYYKEDAAYNSFLLPVSSLEAANYNVKLAEAHVKSSASLMAVTKTCDKSIQLALSGNVNLKDDVSCKKQ